MTPGEFIERWRDVDLTERSAAQSHFHDLCRLLDEPTPVEADPKGEWYCFERGLTKTGGGSGWADVWKRGCFAWEYKRKGGDLNRALAQLKSYAGALENPPLLVVCDTDVIRVHTNWTNTVTYTHEVRLDDLRDPAKRQLLKRVFSDPETLRPGLTRQGLTEAAARKFAELARDLRAAGHDPQAVAHFVNRLVFCMFAEDVALLPNRLFQRLLNESLADPAQFPALASAVFRAMQNGGRLGLEAVEWFNGGLFDSDAALPLSKPQIALVLEAASLDWSDIDPSIFGTLFERGLDPDKRSQLGAHYTDRDKIMLIVDPVIVRPLTAEWETARGEIAAEMEKVAEARARVPSRQSEARRVHAAARRAEEGARRRAERLYLGFREKLMKFRVLDPACGSGNFLYLALLALKDLEHRAGVEAEALGLLRQAPGVGPEVVKGIEINPYAAELARVSIWIGEIQWMRRNGFDVSRKPILKPLDTIECRDAILNEDGSEPDWPKADVIVGNPPFLGGKKIVGILGRTQAGRIRKAFEGRLPAFVDLVSYWIEEARRLVASGHVLRAGLVATNSIRGGSNLKVLDRLIRDTHVFEAWSDEPWTVDGAAVRVSIVCFEAPSAKTPPELDGQPVERINADLTGSRFDLGRSRRLSENSSTCFEGGQKHGPFDIDGGTARRWLVMPSNPNGRPNADVLRPLLNSADVVRRSSDTWVIDFGELCEAEAALYEAPFEYVRAHVRPVRERSNLPAQRTFWWRHHRTRPELRHRLSALRRYIATPVVAKHRIYVWLPPTYWPSNLLDAIARDDDTTFGILHSRFHEAWSLRLGTSLEDRPRYTPSTTFETFPFPEGLTPNVPAADYADDPRARAIAEAARRLNEYREAWLNPPEWVERVPEVVPGFPDRLLPKDEECAKALKTRTLTNLYNERPTWLANAHRELDAAVAAAYGWPADIGEDEALERLLALNLERAAKQ